MNVLRLPGVSPRRPCHSVPRPPAFVRLARRIASLAVTGGAVLMVACQISVQPRDPVVEDQIHSSDDIASETQQIRLRMRSLVDPMTGEIESAADEIIAATSDPAVKRAAIEWKAQAVPALRESLFQPAPLTALFDTWVLTNQMTIFFSSGPGAKLLGEQRRVAVATSAKLERQIRDVAASLTKSGDVGRARDAARNWAAAHPITTSIAHRESTLSRAVERGFEEELSATETIGNVNMTLDDLNRRLEVYTDQLVRQVRWEAELITMDLARQYQLDQAMPLATRAVDSAGRIDGSVEEAAASLEVAVGTIDQLVPLVERLVVVVEEAPELVSAERAAAISALREELSRTIEFVQKERESALAYITSERLAALQTVQDSLTSEREILSGDIEELSIEAIDHAFWRAAQLVGAVVLVVLAAALAGLFLVRHMVAGLLRQQWS